MDAQALRELLEQTEYKLSIFTSRETLNKYQMKVRELLDLISDFLSDEEKIRLFEYPHIQQYGVIDEIIDIISDEQIILQIMNNDNVIARLGNYKILHLIEKLSDTEKKQLLCNQDFIEKRKFDRYDLESIISEMTDEGKGEILTNIDLVKNRLQLGDSQIVNLTKGISDKQVKFRILEICELDSVNYGIINILKTLNVADLIEFLVEHKKFCSKKGLYPYEIICELDSEMQKEFVAKLENVNLPLYEKREILATLSADVKQSIDTTNLPEEYKSALNIQVTEGKRIILDLEKDAVEYSGLDRLFPKINAEGFTEEERKKFINLCNVCPNFKVINSIGGKGEYSSTSREYKEAEEWISSIIDNINPEYSKAQKIAVVDNAIGKKISYSPDFDTEVFNEYDCRAWWRIISSGYGVCNGIASLEQYILARIGIESKIIDCDEHTFLKIEDIELPLANGEVVKGNTILDPTWNLASHRFGGKPDNFCISYEQARKNDIDGEGKDHNCHRNDEELQDATIGLDEQSLRNLFTSVGLVDKDGKFLISILQEKSKLLDAFYANEPERNINTQFLLLKQTCPEFATCQNSSMRVLSDVLLNNENLKFNKCVVNRVYSRTDEEKRPVLYVYINSDELGKRFYFADKNLGQFIELQQEEFVKQFECYGRDLEQYNRI